MAYQHHTEYSAVSVITIATVAVFFFQQVPSVGIPLLSDFSLVPQDLLRGQVWRLLTYGFLHSPQGIWHLAFNMLGLWVFGRELEFLWGKKQFSIFYFFSIFFSGLFSFVNFAYGAGHIPIIGASGAIYALLFVYAAYFPHRQLLLFFVFPVSIRSAVVFFTIFSLLGMMQGRGGIAHVVHLGGFGAGYAYLTYMRGAVSLPGVPKVLSRLFQRKKGPQFYSFPSSSEKGRGDEMDLLDDILRKISRQGISSLSEEEWKILKRHSQDS
ncbi:rhomboid family protein [Chitinivibrio alkaliphilus]|uniref:Rhomboid family protein n=1 Tax=Chitinivibrio alkaliphilus ACht1 TaxID=1313304 RepID=U7D514_9BACT|nr:rhomboid family intramembrane serine protease [Chitinivibrio alkaliphilus]ERP31609.1 Rhomboid family protein [Chitinivibrio alkaliphilus ACht1]